MKEILQKLLNLLDDSIDGFNDGIPSIQRRIFKDILPVLKQLTLDNQGNIKPTASNLKVLRALTPKIRNAVLDEKYKKELNKFLASFDKVDILQENYYKSIINGYKRKPYLDELKKDAIIEVKQNLTRSGIDANIVDRSEEIIRDNIRSNASFGDLVEDMGDFIKGTPQTKGILDRYAKQITTDSLNQYSAAYNKYISDDLGLNWYSYVGGLIQDSREWCQLMAEKRWIHKSELPTLISGNIDGQRVTIYRKTGLPQGMIAGTNSNNVQVLRGGYNCRHQMIPVPNESVPRNIRDKYE